MTRKKKRRFPKPATHCHGCKKPLAAHEQSEREIEYCDNCLRGATAV